MNKADDCIKEGQECKKTNQGHSKYLFHRSLDYFRRAVRLAYSTKEKAKCHML